jgi:hypothetical protein
MTADRGIRWSTALAALGVVAVAAVASYEHAYDLVRAGRVRCGDLLADTAGDQLAQHRVEPAGDLVARPA